MKMDWNGSGKGGKNWFMLLHVLKAEWTEFVDGMYGRMEVKEHNQKWLQNDWAEYVDDWRGHLLKGGTLGKEG